VGIVVNTDPEMIFPVYGCQEHHTISLLFDDADLVVAHEICETILCFRRDWFDFNGVHGVWSRRDHYNVFGESRRDLRVPL
jgi:hypothetical protein